jgi:hypothetical protein
VAYPFTYEVSWCPLSRNSSMCLVFERGFANNRAGFVPLGERCRDFHRITVLQRFAVILAHTPRGRIDAYLTGPCRKIVEPVKCSILQSKLLGLTYWQAAVGRYSREHK